MRRAWQEQRARRRLAELGREQRRRAELPQHQRLDLVGVGQHQPRVGRLVGVGEADDEAVVVPHRLGVDAALLAHGGEDRHRPRRHHPSAERRQQADAPVAQLVAAAFDDDGPVVGDVADGGLLIGQVLQQVLGRLAVEVVLLLEAGQRRGGRLRLQRAHQRADGAAELERPAGLLALPERHLARLARRRRDDDLVVGDVLDAPGRGAEQEGLADGALEDHLFVELADAGGAGRRAGQEHAVEAAIGDGAAVGDRDALGAFARDHRVADAIPGDARPQLGELVGGVAAGQHVEHAVEDAAIEVGERRGPAHHREQLVDRPAVHRHHGDDLLRQHVERVARIARRFDQAFVHAARGRGAGDQVAAVLREDQAFAGGADLVAGAADPLQAARHRWRRLDLDDQIDRAHVDAELERRRRHQPAQPALLERVLDLDALRPGQRAVVGADQRLAGQLVERRGEPLGEAPAVDEDQRRGVRLDQLQQPRMDGGPDRRARSGPSRPGRSGCRSARPAAPCPRPAPRSAAAAPCGARRRRW